MTFQSVGYVMKHTMTFRVCPPVYQDRLGFLSEQYFFDMGKKKGGSGGKLILTIFCGGKVKNAREKKCII